MFANIKGNAIYIYMKERCLFVSWCNRKATLDARGVI